MSKKRDYLIGEGDAQDQLDLFFDWYDIDFDEMLDNAKKNDSEATVATVRNKLIRAIRLGNIEITEKDSGPEETLEITQKLARSIKGVDQVVYQEVTGQARANMRASEKGVSDVARMYCFLGILSKQGPSFFQKLRGKDIGVTDAIGFLFLMV